MDGCSLVLEVVVAESGLELLVVVVWLWSSPELEVVVALR